MDCRGRWIGDVQQWNAHGGFNGRRHRAELAI